MSLKFTPEDFKTGRSNTGYLTEKEASHKAQIIFDNWIKAEAKDAEIEKLKGELAVKHSKIVWFNEYQKLLTHADALAEALEEAGKAAGNGAFGGAEAICEQALAAFRKFREDK